MQQLLQIFLTILLLLNAQITKIKAEDTNSPAFVDTYGQADKTIPELTQYEYLRGKWQIEMSVLSNDAQFKKLETQAYMKAYFHPDKKTFQSEFTTDKGFFSTDIRSWNQEKSKWQIMFLNATAQRWHTFESSQVDGKMITLVPGGYSGKENFDIKAVHEDITANSLSGNIYRTTDQGKTWQLVYKMKFKRLN